MELILGYSGGWRGGGGWQNITDRRSCCTDVILLSFSFSRAVIPQRFEVERSACYCAPSPVFP